MKVIKFRPLLALAAAAAFWFGTPSQAAAETAKQKDIRKLLLLTGSDKLGGQVVDQMIAQFKSRAGTTVPDSFWASVRKEIKVDDLLDLIIPVYDRHLSQPEIKAIIKFYQSPAGKKFIEVLPAITQESMVAGQQWGTKVAERIGARMEKVMPKKGSPKAQPKPPKK